MSVATPPLELIVVGENVHTTRVVLRRSPRVVNDDAGESVGIRFTTLADEALVLPVPDAARGSQDYAEGRLKHVMFAVNGAMAGDDVAAAYIRQLVERQEQAGAAYLDVNVDEISWKLEDQKAAMAWLVDAVQTISDLPISVDSSNVEVIETGLQACRRAGARPLLNSASQERLETLDLALEHNAQVIVTSAGDSGMPSSAEERVVNAGHMVEAAAAKGMVMSDLFIDPLYFPISVDSQFGLHGLDAIRALRGSFGAEIHITGGFSNVSFGIPGRKIINDMFLILAVDAGADSGIIDPVVSAPDKLLALGSDHDAYRLAEDVLLGRDEHCRAYLRAWRKGALTEAGAPPPKKRRG